MPLANIQRRPAWATQNVVDLAYAKLGSSLVSPEELKAGGFAFVGVPFEGLLINEIGGKGGADGIRQALARLRPYSVDLDINFIETNGLSDFGDVEVEPMNYEVSLGNAETVVKSILEKGFTPVVAGGSHTISEATIRAFSEHHGKNIGVVWFDGHPDLMDSYKGDRHYCGCPMRRLIESGHINPERVVFLGLRGFANAAAEIQYGRERGVKFYTMEEFHDRGVQRVLAETLERVQNGTNAVYCTFDTDALDHASAPATQYPGPGGFTAFEAMKLVRGVARGGAGAFDIVEYAPLIDANRSTGSLLATLMCEFMAGRAAFERDQRAT
ncbi:agmatinase family protein [Agrobacterium tumefaciens]|uniref:agmatinase family protein n=1 Tax=Agrobacterium tumefaciens TaxID=358 RepID=UPI001574105A|nr:agmatinase family protein [Agrobacterium tumefaciens]NTE68170.1 agmatinase family protein [Agrobacterium tumefaciens]